MSSIVRADADPTSAATVGANTDTYTTEASSNRLASIAGGTIDRGAAAEELRAERDRSRGVLASWVIPQP